MHTRVIRILTLMCFVSPAVALAVISADPQPMKPVEKEKRRIVERRNDRDDDQNRNRDRDRDDDRDRMRGWDGDRDHRGGPNRGPDVRWRHSPDEGQWVLGLTGDDTEIGVRVTSVVRGSAADRAGLERDDVIVNVRGYQVGAVEGRRYDLGDELQRQADPAGRVTLLIQNRRTRELQNVVVQMQWVQARGRVYGTVSYRERIALPSDAVCFVELVETDSVGRPVRVLEKQLVRMGLANTAAYELNYDPRSIDPRRRYAVQARIEANGRVLMDTPGNYYVLTQGAPDRVDLVLARHVYRGKPIIRNR